MGYSKHWTSITKQQLCCVFFKSIVGLLQALNNTGSKEINSVRIMLISDYLTIGALIGWICIKICRSAPAVEFRKWKPALVHEEVGLNPPITTRLASLVPIAPKLPMDPFVIRQPLFPLRYGFRD